MNGSRMAKDPKTPNKNSFFAYTPSCRTLRSAEINGVSIKVIKGLIIEERVDVIVNWANTHLNHGTGVSGLIVHNGGTIIQQESSAYVMKNGPLQVGEVMETQPGLLNCKTVIHAVGPIYGRESGQEEEYLKRAVTNSLKMAEDSRYESISLPAISVGVFGYPVYDCARLMISAIESFLWKVEVRFLSEIRLTNHEMEIWICFEEEFDDWLQNCDSLPNTSIKSTKAAEID